MKRLSFGLSMLMVLLIASFAFATPYPCDIYSYSSDFSVSYTIMHSGVAIGQNMLIQIIKSPTDVLSPPVSSGVGLGNVGGDNILCGTIGIGDGGVPNGEFYEANGLSIAPIGDTPIGGQILQGTHYYIRVWATTDRFASFPFVAGTLYADGGPFTAVDVGTASTVGASDIHPNPTAANPNWLPCGAGGSPTLTTTVGGNPPANPVDFSSAIIGNFNDVTFNLANTGTADLHVTGLAATGDFAVQGLTSYTITATNNQNVVVRFTPTATGTRTGTLTITHDGPGPNTVYNLSGSGLPTPFPVMGVTIGGVAPNNPEDYGGHLIGTNNDMAWRITNNGTATLHITNMTATGDYSVLGSLNFPISPATFIDVTLRFNPGGTGPRNGTFTIFNDGNTTSPSAAFAVTGNGQAAPQPEMTVMHGVTSFTSGGSVTLPSVYLGNTSTYILTITNTGTANLTLGGFTTTAPFSTTTPASPVAPTANVTVALHFTPTAVGPFSQNFQFTNDAALNVTPFQLTLNGTCTAYNTTPPNGGGNGTGGSWNPNWPNDPSCGGGTPLVLSFPNGSGNPTNVTLTIVGSYGSSGLPGTIPGGGAEDDNLAVHRYWDITPAGGNSGLNCTVTFYFTSDEVPAALLPAILTANIYALAWHGGTWFFYGPSTPTLFSAGTPDVYQVIFTNVQSFSQWQLTEQNPTPVHALTFSASAGDRVVDLRWHVEAEVNNAYYRIERRSITDNSDWVTIGRPHSVATGGTSATPLDYYYEDTYNLVNGNTYEYRIADVNLDGIATNRATVRQTPRAPVVDNYELSNYPNPFNPVTNISFTMKVEGNVKITVTNVMGQVVATLLNGESVKAGTHTITWKAANMPSGIYILNMETSTGFKANRKMLLAK